MHNINNIHVIPSIWKLSLLFKQKNMSSDFIWVAASPHWGKQQNMKTEHKQNKPKSALKEVYLIVI